MLDPNGRALYADSLRPPPGRVFDQAIATTYTLGLDTLLTVPLQLALFDRRDAGEAIRDGVAVLEALRRTTERLSVYYQAGRIHVPSTTHVLYGMLEPIVHAVQAPAGGAFHAKLWVLRFVDPNGVLPTALRVLVLSRNLTFDRSWDLSLVLDGEVYGEPRDENRVLADFVRQLPSLACDAISDVDQERAEHLAADLVKTTFEVPAGFRSARFFAHGLGEAPWRPAASKELVVLSPFCDDAALRALASSASRPRALVSRADELDRLAPSTRARFGEVFVLDETAESEDGEDTSTEPEHLQGLHAKAYLLEIGSDLHLVMGSGNATRPGLLDGRNVELLVELVGPVAKLGGPAKVVEPDDFGAVLRKYDEPEGKPPVDSASKAAENLLLVARESIVASGLSMRCEAEIGGEGWGIRLESREPVALSGLSAGRIWPVTLPDDRAASLDLANVHLEASLGSVALVSITGFVAFELVAPIEGTTETLRSRFVLNLPVDGLPEGRDVAVMRTVIKNQEGFLRYLALLLAELESDPVSTSSRTAIDWTRWLVGDDADDLALLEPLVRALARDPERLHDVRRVVERIRGAEGGEPGQDVIPAAFLDLWAAFEDALELER